jgi:hypothetical protein
MKERFAAEGMEGPFAADGARKRRLPPNLRRFIEDLKAQYPPLSPNEIANIVRACSGRKSEVRSVKRVLDEEALPLRAERNYPATTRWTRRREGDRRGGARGRLEREGRSAKAIAGYLGIERSVRSARKAYARSAP